VAEIRRENEEETERLFLILDNCSTVQPPNAVVVVVVVPLVLGNIFISVFVFVLF
jgi:hypothetical protein